MSGFGIMKLQIFDMVAQSTWRINYVVLRNLFNQTINRRAGIDVNFMFVAINAMQIAYHQTMIAMTQVNCRNNDNNEDGND